MPGTTDQNKQHAAELRAKVAQEAGFGTLPTIQTGSSSLTEGVTQGLAMRAEKAIEGEKASQFAHELGQSEGYKALMGAALGGSKTFTRGEVKAGYRRL